MSCLRDILEAGISMGPRGGIERFASSLEPEWIEEALVATGTASIRRRKLPMPDVVCLVLGMALFADRSIRNVVEHLALQLPNGTVSPGAIPPARYRLGPEPIRWLFRKICDHWADSAGMADFHGMKLYGMDGTQIRVQDSDENFAFFGKPGGRNGSGDAGYPQVRIVALLNLGNRMVQDARFGPLDKSETELSGELWEEIPANSITLLDRGFNEYRAFAKHIQRGGNRHVLVRMRSNVRHEVIQELPDGTLLARLLAPKDALKADASLPPFLEVRIVAYRHPGGEPGRLLTTLVDHELYPAKELIELYHVRWELELAFDELKTHMLERQECIRSKKPDGVVQEVWGILLLYNLVRREMLQVAEEMEVPPQRISFRSSLLWIRDFWTTAWITSPGTLPRRLADFRVELRALVNPLRRTERRYPRHVKIKMSNYPRNRGKRRPTKTDVQPTESC